jgi:hypothetical protein
MRLPQAQCFVTIDWARQLPCGQREM